VMKLKEERQIATHHLANLAISSAILTRESRYTSDTSSERVTPIVSTWNQFESALGTRMEHTTLIPNKKNGVSLKYNIYI
jgi:hypothetical protein